jgi:DNA polymerase-3 subunit delta
LVAVRSSEAERVLAELASPHGRREAFVWLFHGPDEGLVRERCRMVARASVEDPDDAFQIVRLDGDEAARDPGRLSDEARAIGLFGGSKAVWVEVGGRNLIPSLEPLLEDPPQGCVLVLEAGQLKKGAPLRSLVEKMPNGMSVECYPDDAQAIGRLIDAEARAAGLEVDPRARQALIGLLGGDRMASRAELAKLTLFALHDGRITEDHVAQIVADASAPASDDAVDGAFLGKIAMIEEPARRAFADGVDPGVLIGAALRHAALLHRARLELEAGRSRMEIENSHGRAVHFKRAPRFKTQLSNWSAEAAQRALEILAEAMPRIRREPRLAQMTAVRALWSVAKLAEGRGR